MKYFFKCPKCGNDESFVRPTESAPSLGGIFLRSGLLYADYISRRVQCAKCYHLFPRPPLPSTALSKFARWIAGMIIVTGAVAIILVLSHDLASELPNFPMILIIEETIASNARVFAYLSLVIIPLLFLSCGLASWISNRRFRKEFARTHRIHPTSKPDLAQTVSPTPATTEA